MPAGVTRITDTDRINFLESLLDRPGAGRVICRWSRTGHGWRLHETGTMQKDVKWGHPTVRMAIDDFMAKEQQAARRKVVG